MTPKRIEPGPGEESVWDYPRPPRLEKVTARIQVIFAGITLADSRQAIRVLETSHPPNYYLPPSDVDVSRLVDARGFSICEWKGRASYFTVVAGDRRAEKAAWSYPAPTPAFGAIRDFIAFYPGPMDACYVDGERVTPQPGGFYGGWITRNIKGPFKGGAGSMSW
ncbi:MAG: DUF427 domain-containing protein [Candidatus Latescibacterota bacterium]